MLATAAGKSYLFAISAFIIVATNATVGFQVQLFGFSVSWGVILYSLIYLITDILSEYFDRNSAYRLAISNLIIQALFLGYLFFTLPLQGLQEVPSFQALDSLYAVTPRITFAAFVAALGAFVDIWVYEKIRQKYIYNPGILGKLWFRNNLSTFVGQSVNTGLFFFIALYGVLPDIWSIIATAILIKWVIALLDTPILYVAGLIAKSSFGQRLNNKHRREEATPIEVNNSES